MLLPSWMSWQTPCIRKLGRAGKMENQPDTVLLVFNQESNKAVIFFRDLCVQLCFIFFISFVLLLIVWQHWNKMQTSIKTMLSSCISPIYKTWFSASKCHSAQWSLWWGSLLLKKETPRKEVVWGSHVTTNVFSKTFRSFRKVTLICDQSHNNGVAPQASFFLFYFFANWCWK